MRHRSETWLARITLGFVALFAPVETVYSWSDGILSPYYIVDAIAIVLLFAGGIQSLRARPQSRPALMTVGWAWAGANFWRAALARAEHLRGGGTLDFGATELRLAIITTAVAMAFMLVGIWLLWRERP